MEYVQAIKIIKSDQHRQQGNHSAPSSKLQLKKFTGAKNVIFRVALSTHLFRPKDKMTDGQQQSALSFPI